MSSSLQLRQNRAEIVSEMRTICNSKNPADAARWKELDVKQEQLREQIQLAETNNLETELSQVRNAHRPNFDSRELGYSNGERAAVRLTPALSAMEARRSTPEYVAAFDHWCRTGKSTQGVELRALDSDSGNPGSTLVPVGFQKEVATYAKAFGGLRDVSRIVPTATGNELLWPTMADVSGGTVTQSGTWYDGTWTPQNNGPASEADPAFGNITLYADLLDSGVVLVPVQLMQDSAFSMEALLAEAFGTRLGRGAASAYMNGNGLRIPGLLPTLQSSGGNLVEAVGAFANSGVSGETEANSLGSDDFANLIKAVDPAYRNGASFLANQATWDYLRTVKDKYGRPIWESSLTAGEPDRVFGYPFGFDQSLPTIGAGVTGAVVFGPFANKYVIRDVLGMTMVRYNETYMPYHQIGFQAYLRTFGACLIPAAFSYLYEPLS
jgi:HK97 family phage major capsid protein